MTSTTENVTYNPVDIAEKAPCEVAYVFDGGETYAKLKKDDFQKILLERRSAMGLVKVWMVLCFVAACMLGGTTWLFSQYPASKILLVTRAEG